MRVFLASKQSRDRETLQHLDAAHFETAHQRILDGDHATISAQIG